MTQALAERKEQPRSMVELRQSLLQMLPSVQKKIGNILEARDIILLVKSCERNQAILSCSVPSVMGAFVEARSMGWTCDGVTGQAYLVPFAGTATLMPGYRGLIDLVRRSGECEPDMDAIHACDEFVWSGDRMDKPTWRPSQQGDRRQQPVTGAFARGYFFKAGFTKTWYWPVEQILFHRDRYSQNWKRSQKPENPWHPEHAGFWVMCAKTVLIDAIKHGGLPVSQQDRRYVERVESEESQTPIDVEYSHVREPAAYIGDVAQEVAAAVTEAAGTDAQPVAGTDTGDWRKEAHARLTKCKSPRDLIETAKDIAASHRLAGDDDAELSAMVDQFAEKLPVAKKSPA